MRIKHDYSYISKEESQLMEKGYAQLDIYGVVFDRYFTEEEQEENKKAFDSLTREEWNIRCDTTSLKLYEQMLPIKEVLEKRYDIHQINKENSTMEHYQSNWDLHFYSNKGWNNKSHFDYMVFSFNKERSIKQNFDLLNKILDYLKDLDVKNISCRVQYKIRRDEIKIGEKGKAICDILKNKFISYKGVIGKIKMVYLDDKKETYEYIFCKKYSKSKGVLILYSNVILEFEDAIKRKEV